MERITEEFINDVAKKSIISQYGSEYHSEYDTALNACIIGINEGIKLLNLNEINDNNGWIKINSRDDLPKDDGLYLFRCIDGQNRQLWHQDDMSHVGVTHWRPIQTIPNPSY